MADFYSNANINPGQYNDIRAMQAAKAEENIQALKTQQQLAQDAQNQLAARAAEARAVYAKIQTPKYLYGQNISGQLARTTGMGQIREYQGRVSDVSGQVSQAQQEIESGIKQMGEAKQYWQAAKPVFAKYSQESNMPVFMGYAASPGEAESLLQQYTPADAPGGYGTVTAETLRNATIVDTGKGMQVLLPAYSGGKQVIGAPGIQMGISTSEKYLDIPKPLPDVSKTFTQAFPNNVLPDFTGGRTYIPPSGKYDISGGRWISKAPEPVYKTVEAFQSAVQQRIPYTIREEGKNYITLPAFAPPLWLKTENISKSQLPGYAEIKQRPQSFKEVATSGGGLLKYVSEKAGTLTEDFLRDINKQPLSRMEKSFPQYSFKPVAQAMTGEYFKQQRAEEIAQQRAVRETTLNFENQIKDKVAMIQNAKQQKFNDEVSSKGFANEQEYNSWANKRAEELNKEGQKEIDAYINKNSNAFQKELLSNVNEAEKYAVTNRLNEYVANLKYSLFTSPVGIPVSIINTVLSTSSPQAFVSMGKEQIAFAKQYPEKFLGQAVGLGIAGELGGLGLGAIGKGMLTRKAEEIAKETKIPLEGNVERFLKPLGEDVFASKVKLNIKSARPFVKEEFQQPKEMSTLGQAAWWGLSEMPKAVFNEIFNIVPEVSQVGRLPKEVNLPFTIEFPKAEFMAVTTREGTGIGVGESIIRIAERGKPTTYIKAVEPIRVLTEEQALAPALLEYFRTSKNKEALLGFKTEQTGFDVGISKVKSKLLKVTSPIRRTVKIESSLIIPRQKIIEQSKALIERQEPVNFFVPKEKLPQFDVALLNKAIMNEKWNLIGGAGRGEKAAKAGIKKANIQKTPFSKTYPEKPIFEFDYGKALTEVGGKIKQLLKQKKAAKKTKGVESYINLEAISAESYARAALTKALESNPFIMQTSGFGFYPGEIAVNIGKSLPKPFPVFRQISKPVSQIRQNQFNLSIPKQISPTKEKAGQRQISLPKEKIGVSAVELPVVRQREFVIPKEMPRQFERIAQEPRQASRLKQISKEAVAVYPTVRISPPKIKGIIIPPKMKKTGGEFDLTKKKKGRGYLLYTRKEGKPTLVTPTPLVKEEAFGLGAKVTKGTARASFFLKPTAKPAVEMGLPKATQKQLFATGVFRPKIRGGTYVRNPLEVVQKREKRMATRPEVIDIHSYLKHNRTRMKGGMGIRI